MLVVYIIASVLIIIGFSRSRSQKKKRINFKRRFDRDR